MLSKGQLSRYWSALLADVGNLLEGNTHEAIAEYREALRINPDDAEAHWGLAVAFYDQEHFAEAKAEAETALRLDSSNEQARRMIDELTEEG